MKKFCTVLVCLLVLLVCGCQHPPAVSTPYSNNEYGFSVDYPAGWTVEDSKIPDPNFFIISFSEGKPYEGVFITIVGYLDTPEYKDTLEILPRWLLIDEFKDAKGFKLLKEEVITVNGFEAKEFIYTYGSNGEYKRARVYCLVGSSYYVVSYLGTIGDSEYEKYYSCFGWMVNTLKFGVR